MVRLPVVPQCNIPRIPGGRAPAEESSVQYSPPSTRVLSRASSRKALPVAVGVGLAAGAALLNRWLAQKAERDHPPIGRFVTVRGVRLHYIDRGSGTALVLLH